MARGYQRDFANRRVAAEKMYDTTGRRRKAATMVAVLSDFFGGDIADLSVLTVGASTGIIDNHLAQHFGSVIGVDIDESAIEHAQVTFGRSNLTFVVGDAMALEFDDGAFDVVICAQVYEHVPDQERLMVEIHRVLRDGGVCYFAANNRFMVMEPHYRLPLLSILPKRMADRYVRLLKRGDEYYEKHLTYWGLRRLTNRFELVDYTRKVIEQPERFGTEYMVRPGSIKAAVGRLLVRSAMWAVPGYIWLLRKA